MGAGVELGRGGGCRSGVRSRGVGFYRFGGTGRGGGGPRIQWTQVVRPRHPRLPPTPPITTSLA